VRDAGKLGWKMGLGHTYDVCEMQVIRYKSKEECVQLLMHVRVIWVTWLCVKLAVDGRVVRIKWCSLKLNSCQLFTQ
jgi:hypothetical protein